MPVATKNAALYGHLPGDADGKSIEMQLQGTGASFDGTVLQTSVQGLGIKLLQNNTQISPGTGFRSTRPVRRVWKLWW